MKVIPVHCAHDELVAVEKLVPNPRNPNRHPEAQIRLLAHIIEKALDMGLKGEDVH